MEKEEQDILETLVRNVIRDTKKDFTEDDVKRAMEKV